MGCDIHAFCEVRRGGVWRPITAEERVLNMPEHWFLTHCRGELEKAIAEGITGERLNHLRELYKDELHEWQTGEKRDYDSEKGEDGKYPWKPGSTSKIDLRRNYDLFAMLADVRNGRGFAGIETGEGFIPICDPKGLPKDVSAQVKAEAEGWGEDGHSHSWHTLADLKAYFAIPRETRHTGFVSLDEYKVFKEKGKPESWCGDSWGPRVVKLNAAEMERVIMGTLKIDEDKNPIAKISWAESYEDAAGNFISGFMEGMSKLGAPEDVRIVFWFDN